MHCYETELVKLHVNVFTPTLNFLIFVSNQTINIVNTMTVHMYVMYCYIIYICLLSQYSHKSHHTLALYTSTDNFCYKGVNISLLLLCTLYVCIPYCQSL